MSSAQLDNLAVEEGARPGILRQQAAERLAAHRQRRSRHGAAGAAVVDAERPSGRNKIAATVAERYAQSPSYRAFLAEEAGKAIRQAEAAAEVAARSAEAIAAAQGELLAELALWTVPQEFTAATAVVEAAPMEIAPVAPAREVLASGITVRLYEDLGRVAAAPATPRSGKPVALDEAEAMALEEEIAFRQAPVFEDFGERGGSVEGIAANLLEFPRQLVAARKVRPRLAEGPLLEEAVNRNPQLRIFEVEAVQAPAAPAPFPSAPEWSSIRLDAHSSSAPAETREDVPLAASVVGPITAPLRLRALAAGVDGGLVLLSFGAFAVVAARMAGGIALCAPVAIAGVSTVAALFLMYQILFFSFAEQTPGMRIARIGLCTFADENPTRAAMRRRILATLIAACPLGIGLFWVLLDDDRLGWHDRISRMYLRSY